MGLAEFMVVKDLLRRPLRSLLIITMATIGVVVLTSMLLISNAGFQVLENYLKLFKPNMIVVMGPVLPLSPSQAASIPHVQKVITLLITDAYIKCGSNYTYVMLIGFPNFTSLEEIVSVKVVKGSPRGLMVPPPLEGYYGKRCSIILPFLGSYNVTVTGVAKAPVLQSVLGKSRIAFVPYKLLPGAVPNALVILVDNPKNVNFVLSKIDELTGGQAYVISQESILKFDQVIRATTSVVGLFVGTLTLLVAGIAIAVTMLMDIRGRAWEIGLLKALGYTSGQLAKLYVAETLTYAVVALVLGLIVSNYLAVAAQHAFAERFAKLGLASVVGNLRLTPQLVLEAVAVTIGIMLLSAAIPAITVYRMEPVQALRTIAE